MKIAAIQLNAALGDVKANLAQSEQFIKQAALQGAELIVLPEFFTSAIGFDEKMLNVPWLNANTHDTMLQWSARYNMAIGGSYIFFDGENAYNLFELVLPNGEFFSHRKDLPTQFENCYYTNGDCDNVLDTPIGKIGVVLCWEMIRYDTLKRIIGKADIILAGSCWWDLPDDAPPERDELRHYNQRLAEDTPAVFARLAGIPLVHAAHCGKITAYSFSAADKQQTRQLVGAAQIVSEKGDIIAKRTFREGAGFVISDLDFGAGQTITSVKIPDRYWIPDLPESYINAWNTLNPLGKQYYRETALPFYRQSIL